MHCQSDCRGINKMVLMKMLNFEGSARFLVVEHQNANQPRSLNVQNQRICKIKWYVLEGPPESGFGASKCRSLTVFKNNVSVKENVCFGKPAKIWFWNLQINKPASEPKCAQINVSVKENGQFGRARQI